MLQIKEINTTLKWIILNINILAISHKNCVLAFDQKYKAMETEKTVKRLGCCGMYIIFGCIGCMLLASLGCLVALAVMIIL
jgi:hypothetical protein